VRAVAEHDVEQHHADVRVGGLAAQALGAQRRVDHRMRAALGELVLAEVHERVASALVHGLEAPLGPQRDVRGHLPHALGHDHHRLVAQGAAAVEAADVSGRARRGLVELGQRAADQLRRAGRGLLERAVDAEERRHDGLARLRRRLRDRGRDVRIRRLGDRHDHLGGVVGREQLDPAPEHRAADLGAQIAPADADRVRDPDPRRVEQAADLLRAGARSADDADRPALHRVGEAERDAVDDRRAAVGAP
jgi:hypothetical protein